MSIQFPNYTSRSDYKRIDDFLIQHYQPDNQDGIGSSLPGNTCTSMAFWMFLP